MTMFVLFAVNLTAQALVDERRRGTLERLLATRLTAGELFTGKFLAYTARGFVQTLILMLLAYAVFGLFTPLTFSGGNVTGSDFFRRLQHAGYDHRVDCPHSKSGYLDRGLLHHADGDAIRHFHGYYSRY